MLVGECVHVDSMLWSGQMQKSLDTFEPVRPATHVAGRPIDHCFHSAVLAPALTWAETELTWRFPSHRVIKITFSMMSLLSQVPETQGVTLNVPMALPATPAVRNQLQTLAWSYGQERLQLALLDEDVDNAFEFWSDRWEQATLKAAQKAGVHVSDAMTGRGNGELAPLFKPPTVDKRGAHQPLPIRQLRKTWTLMKCWLMDDERATTFLERQRLSLRQASILKRAKDTHDMHFHMISAQSIALIKQRLDIEVDQHEHESLMHWKSQMQSLGPACRFVRAEFVEHSPAIHDEHGCIHVGYDNKSNVLESYWKDVAVPPDDTSLESISAFVKTQLARRTAGTPFVPRPFTASFILACCKRTRKASAPGPGYWRVPEIVQLPVLALAELAQIFTLVSKLKRTPLLWQIAWMSFIPKHAGACKVSDLRPISVTPLLWRIYARHLNQDIVEHVDKHLLPSQFGARPGLCATVPAVRTRAFSDLCMASNTPGFVLQLDIKKCFNNINVHDGIEMLRHFGLDADTCQLLTSHYNACMVRNKLSPRWASRPYRCVRGTPQGCPLSTTLANLVLSLIPMPGVDDVAHSLYLDDTSLQSPSKVQLSIAGRGALANITSLGLCVNDRKSVFTTIGSAATQSEPLVLNDLVLPAEHRTELLGFDINATSSRDPLQKHATRYQTASNRLDRCMRLPVPVSHKQRVVVASVGSLWQWAPLDAQPTANHRTSMRRKVLSTLESSKHAWELAAEIASCVLYKGHLIDFDMSQIYGEFYAGVRFLRMAMEEQPRLAEVATLGTPPQHSLFAVLDCHLTTLKLQRTGMVISSPLTDMTINIDSPKAKPAFEHDLRELVRRHQLAALAARRLREFDGTQLGVNAEWVREALEAATTKPQYIALKRAYTGAYLCRERQSRHNPKLKISPWCSSCGQMESMEHIILHCPALFGVHREYITGIQDEQARKLLGRTGLPAQSEALQARGKQEYIRFTHHLSCSLVRRDIINANREEFWPTRHRLRAKQPRPIAHLLDRGTVGLRLKRARPNVAQRATLDYKLDEEGVWHVNAHEMQPSEQGPEPRLVCRKCKASSLWRLKHVLFTRPCKDPKVSVVERAALEYQLDDEGVWHVNSHEMLPSQEGPEPRLVCRKCNASASWKLRYVLYSRPCHGIVKRNRHLDAPPPHIVREGTSLTCTRCMKVGTTKYSLYCCSP
eukprot:174759-Amphidinium_carterae.1